MAPCPRRCSASRVSSTSEVTGPSAHSTASVSSNNASARAVERGVELPAEPSKITPPGQGVIRPCGARRAPHCTSRPSLSSSSSVDGTRRGSSGGRAVSTDTPNNLHEQPRPGNAGLKIKLRNGLRRRPTGASGTPNVAEAFRHQGLSARLDVHARRCRAVLGHRAQLVAVGADHIARVRAPGFDQGHSSVLSGL